MYVLSTNKIPQIDIAIRKRPRIDGEPAAPNGTRVTRNSSNARRRGTVSGPPPAPPSVVSIGVGFDGPGTEQSRVLDYDAELRLHNQRLRDVYEIGPSDRVLDIGCGSGQTTCEAARLASAGMAHGVDSSAAMIERARHRTMKERLRNVTFQHADAEACRFPDERFDIAISRFGTMFFNDPIAAFTNIGRALRPSARLVMMVWQPHRRNEWSVAIEEALSGRGATAQPPQPGPGPFSLSDPGHVERILTYAGFSEVTFDEVHEPVFYGSDVDAALGFVAAFQSTRELLLGLNERSASQAVERLRQTLATHETGGGVWFDSWAWIVTAQRGRSTSPS